jgi:hypothetical protein
LISPFAFLGLPLFSSHVFFDEPLYIFALPLFSSDVFFNERLCVFEVASFFIGGIFDEPMNEGYESTHLFMAPLVCAKALVECQANLVSYFDLALS